MKAVFQSGCNATAKPTLQRKGATVHEDSDLESINTTEAKALLRSPGDDKSVMSAIETRPAKNPVRGNQSINWR